MILQSGDIISIRSRDAEVFYTGGLLPAGQYPLPRDYDLNVVEAISLVRGPLISGGISGNNFTGTLQNVGVGLPNASLVSIIRPLPGGAGDDSGGDLNRALEDPRTAF